MDNPIAEIEDVIRSLTEPDEASVIAKNVEKYFTPDAELFHPAVDVPRTPNGRDNVLGLYMMLRLQTIRNKIDFHAVMFNEDKTQACIELTEWVTMRASLRRSSRASVRFLVRVDLKKCDDGKYRITRQEDNFPTDLTRSGWAHAIPGLATLNTFVKCTLGVLSARFGRFLLSQGWLG